VIKDTTAPVGADRTTITRPEHISSVFRFQQGVGVHGRNKPFSLTHRVGAVGPLTVLDLTFGVDTWVRCAEQRPYYQVNLLAAGEMDLLHRGSSIASSPGLATVCAPCSRVSSAIWGCPRWHTSGRCGLGVHTKSCLRPILQSRRSPRSPSDGGIRTLGASRPRTPPATAKRPRRPCMGRDKRSRDRHRANALQTPALARPRC
jgi:AraC-binding-like domain